MAKNRKDNGNIMSGLNFNSDMNIDMPVNPNSETIKETSSKMVENDAELKKTPKKPRRASKKTSKIMGVEIEGAGRRKKDKTISVLVYSDVYEEFKNSCKKVGKKPNDVIGKLLEQFNKEVSDNLG